MRGLLAVERSRRAWKSLGTLVCLLGQRPGDGLRDGRRGRQMRSLSVVTCLVRVPRDRDGGAVRSGVGVGSLRCLSLQVLLAGVLQEAALLGRDAVACLVAVSSFNEISANNVQYY